MEHIKKTEIDLTGQQIFRWTVLKRSEDKINKRNQKIKMWKCKCECGTIRDVRHDNLIYKKSKSCGCLKKELITKIGTANSKTNKYDLSGNYGIGWTINSKKEFYFDLEDYDLIKNYCWRENNEGYILSRIPDTKSVIFLHSLVMHTNYEKGEEVDHIKHIKNDNRKSELRIVNKSNNQKNQDVRKNNTSGVTGVTYKKDKGLWVARITVNGKRINLGSSIDYDKAVKLRKDAEEKYFGKYSYDNSMKHNERKE